MISKVRYSHQSGTSGTTEKVGTGFDSMAYDAGITVFTVGRQKVYSALKTVK